MKKAWTSSEIVQLEVSATANLPTDKMEVDDYENGYFAQGRREGSGSQIEIPYYPS